MTTARHQEPHSHSMLDAIRGKIAEHLYSVYSDADTLLGNLDRWTQQRITDENLAKVALVLGADDPGEACYRDLVREIDTEAESGIYLAHQSSTPEHLRTLADEPGVSGQLDRDIETIAPLLFRDEAERSRHDLDLVWITIQSRHDRAHLDATVSEIVMGFLMNDAESVRDMTNVMRSLTYTFHEDEVRRRCKLPLLLNSAQTRDLHIMVTELTERSGNYDDRASEIRRKADSLYLSPSPTSPD
jgi:hypothetical protein